MSARIGILSFPRYFNYGTYLQLYALQTKVAELGYVPELIDYDPYNDSGGKPPQGRSISAGVRRAWQPLAATTRRWLRLRRGGGGSWVESGRYSAFQRFLDTRLSLGPMTYFSPDELMQNPPACDAFIVGSDQVWHPIGHYKDSAYYLTFAKPARRIAYAPSIGLAEIPAAVREWMGARIADIPHLSIREQAGAALVKELTGREAKVVLDPAFLLTAAQWSGFAGDATSRRRPYLLCYFLESDDYMRERAAQIAAHHDWEPLMVPVHDRDLARPDPRFSAVQGVGPADFVRLIRDAQCVCTDSFHGTSFSILFNRAFFTFKRYDNPAQAANHSRLQSILQLTGLEHRLVDKLTAIDNSASSLDFAAANQRIGALRRESLAFLAEALVSALSDLAPVAEQIGGEHDAAKEPGRTRAARLHRVHPQAT